MSLQNYAALVLCVLGIASGQILFKLTAMSVSQLGLTWAVIFSPKLIAALTIYGLATILWIWQLRYIDLSQAYPFMALSFVIVPLAAMFLLGEPVGLRYWMGTALIVGGIVLTVT